MTLSSAVNLLSLILRKSILYKVEEGAIYFNGRTIERKYYMTYEDARDAIKKRKN